MRHSAVTPSELAHSGRAPAITLTRLPAATIPIFVRGTPILCADGAAVASVSPIRSRAPLPPGKYTVDFGDQKVPVDPAEGQNVVINVK